MRRTLPSLAALVILGHGSIATGIERVVGSTTEFSLALAAAQPGDTISLLGGSYEGGFYRSGLTDVVIRRHPAASFSPVVGGGVNGIQLSDAHRVTIEGIAFQEQTGNGINIDDGGSFATPSTDITIRNVSVSEMQSLGNSDGIKLSGVTGFLIEKVTVRDWGAGGSAVDPVGSHNGIIRHSSFVSTVATGGSAIRPKGGSKNILIRGNYVVLPDGAGRGIQAGGSTGSEFYRFIDGDSGYEADDITVEGNVIIGGSSAISWVNIDGGVFHRNVIYRPGDWAFRILNENTGEPIVQTQNGVMADNVVLYDSREWRRAGNFDGPGVLEESFTFSGNQWLDSNPSAPSGTPPVLPTPEVEGIYQGPALNSLGPQVWSFDWGKWIVTPGSKSPAFEDLEVENYQELLYAYPGEQAAFSALEASPLMGDWSFEPVTSRFILNQGENEVILIRPDASTLIPDIPGDYDRSGSVDLQDYDLWRNQYGLTGSALADGNGDRRVDAADYALWRNAYESQPGAVLPAVAPEPSTLLGVLGLGLLTRTR